jgi:hypothetical protein
MSRSAIVNWARIWRKELQPLDQAAEVVADGGENGIDGITLTMPEIVAAHPVFGFEMADDGLSGCSPPCTDLTGLPANGGFYFQAFGWCVHSITTLPRHRR